MLSIVALLCLVGAQAANPACAQSTEERNKLIYHAERNHFTLRRTEFVGLTYTRDDVLRNRMTPIINEGDEFTRAKLLASLRRMSGLEHAIYPLRLTSVVIRLDESGPLR